MKKRYKVFLFFLATAILGVAATLAYASTRFPIRHIEIIEANAGELDVSLILAIIMAESSFDVNAQSHAGAQGLMQLMPPTAQDMAERMGKADFMHYHIWRPETNIAIGTFYLNWLYARYSGNIDLMLAAYNAGLGRVDRWLADPEFSQDGISLDAIPFPETYNYLNRIRTFQWIYRVLLAMPWN